eukprot:CAMPEP_0174289632 /NCGR_PEP_ID=MMETSP0809-20121228/25743_1 /TAXON_ID=73025 ORGANISM="Eutreptiella gymnastica-like, Strain CCMP1594" /NCGR_SAMPLE_ID=MMETSP0809 /ASSEMBLY_ACC=CAM_ASM_000658 /LENGTH=112 /DNA_ID=CAMNT_0015387695 /DNA_START=200 /DNA_END=535 /DNA_ORIENTATION=-
MGATEQMVPPHPQRNDRVAQPPPVGALFPALLFYLSELWFHGKMHCMRAIIDDEAVPKRFKISERNLSPGLGWHPCPKGKVARAQRQRASQTGIQDGVLQETVALLERVAQW